MSIKRISRNRVAAPIMEYVDEELLATKVNTSVDAWPNDNRTGGDVETKINPPVESKVGGGIQSREGTNIETRTSTDVEFKDHPQMSRWSV